MSNPSSVHFEIDHAMENPAWDELVARSTGAHHEQTTAWARRKKHHGWQAYRIIIHEKGRAIGGAQVLHRRILKLVSIGYISRGPISESADLLALVTQQVIEGLKITAHAYVVMLPSYRWQNIVPTLLGNEFYPKPNLLLPGHPVTATSIIDLNQDLNALFAKTRASVRNNIRRGLKGGLEVVQGRETDIGTMHRLLCQLCARRGIDPSPASAQELHDIWHCLAPHGLVKIFLCRYQSEIVSAAFTFVCGSSMLVAKVGWSGEHQELRPNHLMWWEMIKWAKEAGLKQFDLHHLRTQPGAVHWRIYLPRAHLQSVARRQGAWRHRQIGTQSQAILRRARARLPVGKRDLRRGNLQLARAEAAPSCKITRMSFPAERRNAAKGKGIHRRYI